MCKAEEFKKDPAGPRSGSSLLAKSVTFVGLPPSTSPDSSPVSTQSIVSSASLHLTHRTKYFSHPYKYFFFNSIVNCLAF